MNNLIIQNTWQQKEGNVHGKAQVKEAENRSITS